MYCPRCGSQNTDSTKFCRQCGLPLMPVMDYVATGGLGALAQPPATPPPPVALIETSEMLALKAKRTLTILGVCTAPIVLTVITNEIFNLGDIAGLSFLLVPLGIVWAKYRYRTQLRQLQERQLQEYYAHQRDHQQSLAPKLILQPQSDPQRSAQVNAPRTNPLPDPVPASVVEDETRKLPE